MSLSACIRCALLACFPVCLLSTAALAGGGIPYLVKEINPGPFGSMIEYKTQVGTRLFFQAHDGVHGAELWVSDGTQQGTYMVADLVSDPQGTGPTKIIEVDGRGYFQVENNVGGMDLYVSDGTLAGTQFVTMLSDAEWYLDMAPLDDLLLFVKEDAQDNNRLWKTDGTPSGTTFLKDVRVNQIISTGSRVFFAGSGPGQTIPGYDLWTSDGTPNGTVRLRDLAGCLWLRESNGLVFFEGEDPQGDDELWVTDGTSQGTRRVKEINPGPNPSAPSTLRDVNGILFFIAFSPGFGRELWKSDGTEAGTQMIVDLAPGSTNCGIYDLINVNGVAFFPRFDPVNGWELWKSDGTAPGTVLIRVIAPPSVPDDQRPDYFAAVNGKLYFSATDGVHGEELWGSNGEQWSTLMVDDTTPGVDGSHPSDLIGVGTSVFYSTSELWAFDNTTPVIPAASTGTVVLFAGFLVVCGVVIAGRLGGTTRFDRLAP